MTAVVDCAPDTTRRTFAAVAPQPVQTRQTESPWDRTNLGTPGDVTQHGRNRPMSDDDIRMKLLDLASWVDERGDNTTGVALLQVLKGMELPPVIYRRWVNTNTLLLETLTAALHDGRAFTPDGDGARV